MVKLDLTHVSIFVKDLKAARAFYTRKIGLKVRESESKMGYLVLGPTKGGEDAGLNPWQPTAEWGPDWEKYLKQIGGVTGIGFLTTDIKRTVADLKKKGVKATGDRRDPMFGRFTDLNGNVLFLAQPPKVKAHRAGLSALAFASSETPPAGPPWKREWKAAQAEAIAKGLPIFVYLTKTY